MATTDIPKIKVEQRTQVGTRYAQRLRKSGRLPAVIYGHKQDPVHISVDAKQMIELLHRQAHVIEVAVDSTTEACLVKDIQWDFKGAEIVHIDFARVDLTEKVRTEVALELLGEPAGLKEHGAMLEHRYAELEIECQAGNIPTAIRVEIGDLTAGTPLTVADVQLPEGVTCTMSPTTVLAAITFVLAEPEPEPVEAGEVEPEVIGGKKPEGETEGEESKE